MSREHSTNRRKQIESAQRVSEPVLRDMRAFLDILESDVGIDKMVDVNVMPDGSVWPLAPYQDTLLHLLISAKTQNIDIKELIQHAVLTFVAQGRTITPGKRDDHSLDYIFADRFGPQT